MRIVRSGFPSSFGLSFSRVPKVIPALSIMNVTLDEDPYNNAMFEGLTPLAASFCLRAKLHMLSSLLVDGIG